VTEPEVERASKSRFIGFSDGIFAIAATLLVLDLSPPHVDLESSASLWSALFNKAEFSEYAAFAVSFMVIAITWINHQSFFRQVARVDRRLTLLNVLLLLDLSFLPFPTRVLAEYLTDGGADAHAAAFFYSIPMALMGVIFTAMWWHVSAADSGLLIKAMSREDARNSRLVFCGGSLFYLLSLGLAFLSAEAVLALQALLALYYAFDPLGA
jgi:uncharacterized membrane protein